MEELVDLARLTVHAFVCVFLCLFVGWFVCLLVCLFVCWFACFCLVGEGELELDHKHTNRACLCHDHKSWEERARYSMSQLPWTSFIKSASAEYVGALGGIVELCLLWVALFWTYTLVLRHYLWTWGRTKMTHRIPGSNVQDWTMYTVCICSCIGVYKYALYISLCIYTCIYINVYDLL